MTPPAAPLSQLLAGIEPVRIEGDPDVEINQITHDSRQVTPGALFIAYHGVYQDVHQYIPDAVRRGAVAVIVERPIDDLCAEMTLPPGVTVAQVVSARRARSMVAAALHAHPSRDMTVIGVTGTDGKTTTSTLVHAILSSSGRPTGLVSTVGAEMGGRRIDTGLHTTTPEPEDVQAYLAQMRDAGVEVAVLEVTSHGLDQHRVTDVAFDIAAITNITHEALEYHETFAEYRRAKARLFRLLSEGAPFGVTEKTAVLNAGDRSYTQLARIPVARQLTYSLSTPADFTAEDITHTTAGLAFTAVTPAGRLAIQSPLLGYYNVANILAAIAVAFALGTLPEAWATGVASMRGIPGRMELIDGDQPFMAIIDFAHTPNALSHALDTARELVQPTGRVIAVFGCAGLRDAAKRPLMGRAAGEMADLTIVTAEDPRTEPLDLIMDAVAEGLRGAGAREGQTFHLVPDRFEAIRRACEVARPADVVIVLGKGHEQSMCFGTTEYPWDDRDAVRAALRGASYGNLPTSSPSG